MRKTLISGCEGFVGSHPADLLVEIGLPVYGMVYLVISRLLPSYFRKTFAINIGGFIVFAKKLE